LQAAAGRRKHLHSRFGTWSPVVIHRDEDGTRTGNYSLKGGAEGRVCGGGHGHRWCSGHLRLGVVTADEVGIPDRCVSNRVNFTIPGALPTGTYFVALSDDIRIFESPLLPS